MKIIKLLIGLMLLGSFNIFAVDVIVEKGSVAVDISKGDTTIFRFESPVKTISNVSNFDISPADSKNPDYSILKIKPNIKKGVKKTVFILTNGKVIIVEINVKGHKGKNKSDLFYDFKTSHDALMPMKGENEFSLMKAMLQNKEIEGFVLKDINTKLDNQKDGFSIVFLKLYMGDDFYGHIFKITNISQNGQTVDQELLKLNQNFPVILSQSDKTSLRPLESTYFRVVTKINSSGKNKNIPHVFIEEK